jgi:hypothetical protein
MGAWDERCCRHKRLTFQATQKHTPRIIAQGRRLAERNATRLGAYQLGANHLR